MKRMPVISGLDGQGALPQRLETCPTGGHQPFDYEEGWRAGSSLNSDEG